VHAQADSAVYSGYSGYSGELRPSSGRAQDVLRHAQECSPSAQVKAAAAHVQTLKQNQRKKKLSLTYVVISDDIFSNAVSQRRRSVVNGGLARNETPQKTEVKPSSFRGVLFGINRLMDKLPQPIQEGCQIQPFVALGVAARFRDF
jgi:hypothetical protein